MKQIKWRDCAGCNLYPASAFFGCWATCPCTGLADSVCKWVVNKKDWFSAPLKWPSISRSYFSSYCRTIAPRLRVVFIDLCILMVTFAKRDSQKNLCRWEVPIHEVLHEHRNMKVLEKFHDSISSLVNTGFLLTFSFHFYWEGISS